MSRQEQERRAEARWLDSLRYGYTDVHPTVENLRSFDAQWADGHWVHDPHPEMFREATLMPQRTRASAPISSRQLPAVRRATAPVPAAIPATMSATLPLAQPVGPPIDGPPQDLAAGNGRVFFLILFWFTLATSVELWWLNSPAHSITDTSSVFLAIGRITGMVGGFVLLFQILLMSRVGWLERWIGAHDLLIWHRDLGSYLLVLILVHMAATIVGYAVGAQLPILREAWSLISGDSDMITATIATAILVAVGLMSIRALRRL